MGFTLAIYCLVLALVFGIGVAHERIVRVAPWTRCPTLHHPWDVVALLTAHRIQLPPPVACVTQLAVRQRPGGSADPVVPAR